MITPEQRDLVQGSFALVAPIAGQAADLFYDRLFEIEPGVHALFPDDMTEQKQKLMQMLAVAVKGLDDIPTLLPAIQALGRRHAGYGVREDHYDAVGAALLWTLAAGLGDAFTPEVETAWSETYELLASAMKDASRAAA